mmetsp:Transcript_33950/g.41861  ORF Transcript_33950/g.41861 Transcript_33950/m.41861 type:complete len:189 (+) Transcript_33950:238-804(+)
MNKIDEANINQFAECIQPNGDIQSTCFTFYRHVIPLSVDIQLVETMHYLLDKIEQDYVSTKLNSISSFIKDIEARNSLVKILILFPLALGFVQGVINEFFATENFTNLSSAQRLFLVLRDAATFFTLPSVILCCMISSQFWYQTFTVAIGKFSEYSTCVIISKVCILCSLSLLYQLHAFIFMATKRKH